MLKLLPSDAVRGIAELFPFTNAPSQPEHGLGHEHASRAAAVVALLDAVSPELLVLSGGLAAELVQARALVSAFVEEATARGSGARPLRSISILAIRQLLERCPDQAVPASTALLEFLPDEDFRRALRVDIAEVERALADAEWKSATVVTGSIIEALLLSRLNETPEASKNAARRLKESGAVNTVKETLEEWDLHHYIEVADDLGLIDRADTVPQLRLAKGFRNLIHPGRAQRLARACDRPTALAALAGLGFLIRDLAARPAAGSPVSSGQASK